MQSLFGGGQLGLLGGGGDTGGLKEDGCGSVAWNSSTLPPDDVYSASHFALITAYQDIKTRLVCLERENTSIKRKLKIYEIKVKGVSLQSRITESNIARLLRTNYHCCCFSSLLVSYKGSPVATGIRLVVFFDLLGVFQKGRELSTHPEHFPFLLRAVRLCTEIRGKKALVGFDPGPAGE